MKDRLNQLVADGTENTSFSRQIASAASLLRGAFLGTPQMLIARLANTEVRPQAPVISIPCEDAFSVIVQLADFHSHKLWRGGRLLYDGGHVKSSIFIVHLADEWHCQHLSAFDNMRFHLPRAAHDTFTYDSGQKRIRNFDGARGKVDAVVYRMAQALLPLLDMPNQFNQLYFDHLALYSHISVQYGEAAPMLTQQSGKLASWQERRAKDFMQENLGQDLSLECIARECCLSRAHFARYFKNSTGMPAHK